MSNFVDMDCKVVSSAPGKVILFGEHAVVHKVTAIAAALSDLRLFVKIEPFSSSNLFSSENENGQDVIPHLRVTFEDFRENDNNATVVKVNKSSIKSVFVGKKEDPHTSIEPTSEEVANLNNLFQGHNPAVSQCLSVVTYLVAKMFPEFIWNENYSVLQQLSLDINIASHDLPVGAGLGSSAAFSVAMVGAVYRLRQILLELSPSNDWSSDNKLVPSSSVLTELNGWAYMAEVLLHGKPSGLDNTTSCHGGFVSFTRKNIPTGEFKTITDVPKLTILLTNTNVPRSTKLLVEGVGELLKASPDVVNPIFDSIEGISQEFLKTIRILDGDKLDEKVATLFTTNHSLLNDLGVGHPALTTIVTESHSLGFATKLTGAGGGGCAITLLNSNKSTDSVEALKKALGQCSFADHGSFKTFESEIGGVGLQWHKPQE